MKYSEWRRVRSFFTAAGFLFGVMPIGAPAQVANFVPVTQEVLSNPSPDDWLMYSRTHDNQRFSPLKQITRQNVGQLGLAWSRGMSPGIHEHIPLVYRGVMYVANPGGVQALNAVNGDLIWEYQRKPEGAAAPAGPPTPPGRAGRTMAIYGDLIIFAAPDNAIVGIDARTGEVRWQTKSGFSSSGAKAADGKVFAGVTKCGGEARSCIIALDAATGKEAWRFYTTPAPGEPGGESWGTVPVDLRITNPWGLPGGYDPVRKLIYWGIANPQPHTRLQRHGNNPDDIPRSTPADLYSNSTVALDVDTGKLAWYYQHLPGDDWDLDHTQERILLRTPFNPDPASVKWVNPGIPRGQERDVLVSVSEGGGIWVNDRDKGQFLWATPFPYDVPDFHISHIDVETGKTYINWDKVFKKMGENTVVCFFNTKGHWPMAYHPARNSLYVPYNDSCLDMTAGGARKGVVRAGSDPKKFAGIAKVNMATGQIEWRYTQRVPGNGAVLATAGDLIFWGDLDRRFRALDAGTGKVLWEAIVGGIVQESTITYSVAGRQYVAVLTGDSTSGTTGLLAQVPELKTPRGHNAIYVFALPERR